MCFLAFILRCVPFRWVMASIDLGQRIYVTKLYHIFKLLSKISTPLSFILAHLAASTGSLGLPG